MCTLLVTFAYLHAIACTLFVLALSGTGGGVLSAQNTYVWDLDEAREAPLMALRHWLTLKNSPPGHRSALENALETRPLANLIRSKANFLSSYQNDDRLNNYFMWGILDSLSRGLLAGFVDRWPSFRALQPQNWGCTHAFLRTTLRLSCIGAHLMSRCSNSVQPE